MSNGLALALGLLAGLAVGAVAVGVALSRRLSQVLLERDEARHESAERHEAASELREQLASVEADRAARVEEMARQQAEIEGRFKAVAAEVSRSTRAAFMEDFRDLTNEQTAKASKTVNELVEPMRVRLQELQQHIHQANEARVADTTKVSQSVDQLVTETSGLRQILRDSKMRGAWGEQHLRNVIEAAGMLDHVDFQEQVTVGGSDTNSRLRPDVVVNVPGGTHIVIDAKTPFTAYFEAVRTQDDAERERLLADHARAVNDRAKELGSRNYQDAIDGLSPDFVLMYVPTDPMLDVAMESDAQVWQRAWRDHKVLIATPGLLIAFLRTVALAWQRYETAKNADEIIELGSELCSRLSTYVGHVDKLGRGLRSAVGAYNDSVGSFERMVLPQARRFRDLSKATGSEALNAPNSVDRSVRAANAPELGGQIND